MKILYDYQTFNYQHFGGVSKCFCELISHLPKEDDYEIAILESRNEHIAASGLVPNLKWSKFDNLNFLKGINFRGKWRLFKILYHLPWFSPDKKINRAYSEKLIKAGHYDVFHPTFFDTYYLNLLVNKPLVVTVHDMIPEIMAMRDITSPFTNKNNSCQIKLSDESRRKRMLSEKADAIVAVSQQTKNDLVKIFGIPENKIFVVHHGGPKREDISDPAIILGKYYLFVGHRSSYKNFKQTAIDFSGFIKKHNDVKLVCTGIPFNDSEKQLLHDLSIEDYVKYIHPDDKQMKNLYAHALAFIYPSIYEGFGMPILEAYAYGCPCLLNHASCFPEVAGEAAIYFHSEPGKSDLTNAMDTIYGFNDQERNNLINLGYNRLEQFTWEKAAKKLSAVYHSIARI